MAVKRAVIIGTLFVLLSNGYSSADPHPRPFDNNAKLFNFHPPGGVVPDAETAIQVAVAILSPIYGKDTIADEKPFKAILHDGIWTVRGTFNQPGELGGVAVIEIEKSDGRVNRISHGM